VRHHDDRTVHVLVLFFKKNRIRSFLAPIGLGMLGLFLTAAAPPPASTPASASQSLIDYLLRPGRNIAVDKRAQTKFLAATLRQKLEQTTSLLERAAKCPNADPDSEPLDNQTLLQAWEAPTRCEIGTVEVPDPTHAEVPLHCLWLEGTNYPGMERDTRFYLVQEAGQWLVEDVRSAATRFSEDTTLLEDLIVRQRQAAAVLAECPAPNVHR
jgi:hypothetical protein